MTFETNWLQWPFKRFSREFRVYVVEPKTYAPKTHGEVFDAVFRDFFDTASSQSIASEVASTTASEPIHADLIVFPEAFLAAADLVRAMQGFMRMHFQCCMHIGLRPDWEEASHLFSISDIKSLLSDIKFIPTVSSEDLERFEDWLNKQRPGSYFNLACMFLVDAQANLRVCLHPKAVRAGIEYGALPDTHMAEANLLSLVTLVPPDSRHMSVTIQPLICSDSLSLPTDSMAPNPIKAFCDSSAAQFPRLPSDHIDIVSLSLCTPVGEVDQGNAKRRRWKPEFELAFIEAGKRDDCFRHHFATFVMANFDSIDTKKGGLSGACMPAPFSITPYPEGVSMWSYGRHEPNSADGWKCVAGFGVESPDNSTVPQSRKNRPNLICLDDANEKEAHVAKALGFTLSRLVRDNPVGGKFPGLTKFDVRSIRDTKMTTASDSARTS